MAVTTTLNVKCSRSSKIKRIPKGPDFAWQPSKKQTKKLKKTGKKSSK